jgi:hypothetical protein
MLEHKCFDVPLLNGKSLAGHTTLEDCMNAHDEPSVSEGFVCISIDSHIYDALALLTSQNRTCLALVNLNFEVIGLVTQNSIQQYLGTTTTAEQRGAVLVIEMASYDYSGSEICRIIESENAHVLGFWISNLPNSNRVRLNVKINTQHAESIILSMRRFGFDVVGNFGDDDYRETVEKRFKALLTQFDL